MAIPPARCNLRCTVTIICLVVVSAGCSESEDSVSRSGGTERQDWDSFVVEAVAGYYDNNPEAAVYAGLHDYDGEMTDVSLSAREAYADWIDRTLEQAAEYSNLGGIKAFERDYLSMALAGEKFWIRESGFLTSNPVYYANRISLDVYIDREYAPLEQRIVAYTDYVSQLPKLLQTMRRNLRPPLPAPYIKTAQGIFSGMSEYLENTVPGLFADVGDEQLQRRFAVANQSAADAAKRTAHWLDGLKATASDDFALGEATFLAMLRATEGIDIALDDLKAAGELNLRQNLDSLFEACAEFAPGESTEACVQKVQSRKPPEGAVGGAARQLPALRQFVEDRQLVSIPGTENAVVDEAPPHRRFNSAYIEIPGPFESGLPSVYYIAPPDPGWSEEDQLAYIPGEKELLGTSVHEIWPGHFLQFLHANRTANAVGRHFTTYSFVEGWAHYAEQMMIDAGFGNGDPEVRIGQLLKALLRNVRYLSAIGLHTGGMTVENSQRMFEEKAYRDFGNASQQAYRGTYDPGYLNYTLGKLMINKLRDDWIAGEGGVEAWGRFHDEFLSFGSPPVPLVRRQMLGDTYEGDAALLPH